MNAAILRVLALLVAISALMCASASAQDAVRVLPEPDAIVRGTGTAMLADPDNPAKVATPAMFRIDVARFPLSSEPLRGGFYIRELLPSTASGLQRSVIIVSRRVTDLRIEGNKATVRADGAINGRACCLTLEVLDDNPGGDWLSIRADGCMLDVIYYNKAGGVKQGDIRVWQKPPVAAFAKGFGSINILRYGSIVSRIGNFEFTAENTADGPEGKLVYRELDTRLMQELVRPLVAIEMTALKEMVVVGNRASLFGEGTMNDRKVHIWVTATDNSGAYVIMSPVERAIWPPPPSRDVFSIAVNDPLMPSLVPLYHASGTLTRGDIVVGRYSVTPVILPATLP